MRLDVSAPVQDSDDHSIRKQPIQTRRRSNLPPFCLPPLKLPKARPNLGHQTELIHTEKSENRKNMKITEVVESARSCWRKTLKACFACKAPKCQKALVHKEKSDSLTVVGFLVSIIHPILNSLSSALALEIHFENKFRTLGVISKSKVFRVDIALLRINAKGLMI